MTTGASATARALAPGGGGGARALRFLSSSSSSPSSLLPLAARHLTTTSSTAAPTTVARASLRAPSLPSLPPRRAAAAAGAAAAAAPARRVHTSARAAAAAAAAAEQQQAAPKDKTPWGQKSPLSFNSMIAGLAVFLGIVAVAQGTADKRVGDMMKKSQQVAGKAAVGGPFRLIDTKNKPFTNRDLLGEFALLYFGFTHCPDICPDELEKVAEAVDAVERRTGAKVVPVFISVDPKRDTPARVATYVREFHPRMVGLTGSEQAVTDAAKSYRVYFSRTDTGGGDAGAGSATSDSDDYLVDHSIITYLIDPNGEFVTFYGKNFDAEQLADSIAGHVMAWAEKDESYLSRLACPLVVQPGGGGGGGRDGNAKGQQQQQQKQQQEKQK